MPSKPAPQIVQNANDPQAKADAASVFGQTILRKLTYDVGKDADSASDRDWLIATVLATRDHMVDPWMETTKKVYADGRKRVYYLSLETGFLVRKRTTQRSSCDR